MKRGSFVDRHRDLSWSEFPIRGHDVDWWVGQCNCGGNESGENGYGKRPNRFMKHCMHDEYPLMRARKPEASGLKKLRSRGLGVNSHELDHGSCVSQAAAGFAPLAAPQTLPVSAANLSALALHGCACPIGRRKVRS